MFDEFHVSVFSPISSEWEFEDVVAVEIFTHAISINVDVDAINRLPHAFCFAWSVDPGFVESHVL